MTNQPKKSKVILGTREVTLSNQQERVEMSERIARKVSAAEAEELLDESVEAQARAEEKKESGRAAIKDADEILDEIDSLLDTSEELIHYRQQGGE